MGSGPLESSANRSERKPVAHPAPNGEDRVVGAIALLTLLLSGRALPDGLRGRSFTSKARGL